MMIENKKETSKPPQVPAGMEGFPGLEGMGGFPGMGGLPGMGGFPGMGGMPGMMPGGPEGGNPFDFSGMSEEDSMKVELVSLLYQKLMEGNASPEFIAEAKKVLGEEDVNAIINQYETMPEEEKKAAQEYQKMYQAMAANFETALKEQGVDLTNPDMNPDALMKGMASMFTKVVNEHHENPEFQEAMNSLGENLYNKELLYPPLKKLCELYPGWIEENKEKADPKDIERYKGQLELLKKICALFESDKKDIVGLIQMVTKLTEYGTPPEEIAKQVEMPQLFGGIPPH